MKRKRQAGQAFILVLIILAIGALVVVPTLRLTTTVLKSSQTITQRNKGLYACEAAQQKIMWMLYNDIDSLVSENLSDDGDSISFTVDVCGTTVYAGITMRAVELEGGVVLAGEDTIMPTKTVTPGIAIKGVDDTFTYTIRLEQVSSNNTDGLDAIYDILPAGLKTATADYVLGTSRFRVEGGDWEDIGDPRIEASGGQYKLRWPDPDTYGSESFLSPIRDFDVNQVKELEFKVYGRILENNTVQCNWVVLQVGDVYTLSGPQAPISVGDPPDPDGCASDGLFDVYKTSEPTVIPPLESTLVTYTVHITNMDGNVRHITQIDDYLPPGFEYVEETTGGDITIGSADWAMEDKNGVVRQHLWWDQRQEHLGSGGWSIAAGENVTLIFQAWVTQGVSGSYYNEILVTPKNVPSPTLFTSIDTGYDWSGVFSATYSWNSGTVIVPAYDSTTGAEGENITASLALDPDSVRIISWHPQ